MQTQRYVNSFVRTCEYEFYSISFVFQSGGRKYVVAGQTVHVRKLVIEKFTEWSTGAFVDDVKKDELFVRSLIRCCLSEEEIRAGNIKRGVMHFVKGIILSTRKSIA